jgi:hypothetical protein
MSKDAKLLFISLGLFLLVCTIVIFNSKYECNEIKYQNLDGVHTKTICKEK